MAREIVVWCDPCTAEGERNEGHELPPIAFGNKKGKIVALCPRHHDMIVKPLEALLDEFGETLDKIGTGATPRGPRSPADLTQQQRHGRQPADGRPNQCLWCPLDYSSNSSGGFTRHLRTRHGFASLTEAFGNVCPVCGGGQYEHVFAHATKSHPELGFVATAQPFIWARDNGDPFGVYADRLAAVPSLDPEEAWRAERETEKDIAERSAAKKTTKKTTKKTASKS